MPTPFCDFSGFRERLEPMDDTHRRRRRRHSESVPRSPLRNPETNHGSSAPLSAGLTPSEHRTPLAPLPQVTVALDLVPTPRLRANSTGPSVRLSHNTDRHTGKRRASGEMIHHEEEAKSATGTPHAGNESRRPDLPQRPVVSSAAQTSKRVSTRRTTTTTRWSPSMAGDREQIAKMGVHRASKVTPPARPISNATRNINFDMLQPHFEGPLQHAADSFGVCTTLLKKICRRNGISNWPYRKICGLRKSIASMAKQVNYFDGEQKRAYADQLEKLEQELHAYLRTGNEPTEEFLRALEEESDKKDKQTLPDARAVDIGNEEEEKEAREVPTWTARPSIVQPQYIAYPANELQNTPPSAQFGGNAWHSVPVGQAPVFPTIATHHRALPSIASILQHQSYSSPSRAASTQDPRATSSTSLYEDDPHQPPQWRYFPPANDDAV